MTVIEIKVPDIGDYSKVPVIEVLVTVGDHLVKNQGILTLESDKATLEVPSMNNGIVKELKVNVGDLLSQGDVILLLETEDTTAPLTKQRGDIRHHLTAPAIPPTSRFQADSTRSTTLRHQVPHGRTRCRSRRLHRSIPRR